MNFAWLILDLRNWRTSELTELTQHNTPSCNSIISVQQSNRPEKYTQLTSSFTSTQWPSIAGWWWLEHVSFLINWESSSHHPNWQTHIFICSFQRARLFNHQPSSLIHDPNWPLITTLMAIISTINQLLVGGLEYVLFFHIFEIIIPIGFHIFQRGKYTTNQTIYGHPLNRRRTIGPSPWTNIPPRVPCPRCPATWPAPCVARGWSGGTCAAERPQRHRSGGRKAAGGDIGGIPKSPRVSGCWWLELHFYDIPMGNVGNVIIPIDRFIFFRGVGIPPTRFQYT